MGFFAFFAALRDIGPVVLMSRHRQVVCRGERLREPQAVVHVSKCATCLPKRSEPPILSTDWLEVKISTACRPQPRIQLSSGSRFGRLDFPSTGHVVWTSVPVALAFAAGDVGEETRRFLFLQGGALCHATLDDPELFFRYTAEHGPPRWRELDRKVEI